MKLWSFLIGGAVAGAASAQPPAAPTPGITAQAIADTLPPDTTFHYAAALAMDEVVANALRYSPVVAQARGAVHSGLSNERVAYGTFLPNVTFNANALQENTKSTPLAVAGTSSNLQYSPNSYWAGFSASYDLFTGGAARRRSRPRKPSRTRRMHHSSSKSTRRY